MEESDSILLKQLCSLVGHQRPETIVETISQWERLFRKIPLQEIKEIAELGPGISPKLQFALKTVNYSGHLTLVDLDDHALITQEAVATLLRPNFTLETHRGNLYNLDLTKFSLIVANHLIDDLVSASYSEKYGVDYKIVFHNPDLQRDFWKRVQQETETGEDTMNSFARKLAETSDQTIIIINTYQANFDRNHALETRASYCQGLLDSLKGDLQTQGFRDIPLSDDLSLGSGWLVMQKRATETDLTRISISEK